MGAVPGRSTESLDVIDPMANNVAPVRIEVLLNGRRIAIAGVEQFGVVSAIVSWVLRDPSKITAEMRADPDFNQAYFLREKCELDLGGFDSPLDRHISWAHEAIGPGSEVTIRSRYARSGVRSRASDAGSRWSSRSRAKA